MKIKHILIILGIGYSLELIAYLFQLMNWPFGGAMFIVLIIAGLLKTIGFISLIYKSLTNPKFKDFLNC